MIRIRSKPRSACSPRRWLFHEWTIRTHTEVGPQCDKLAALLLFVCFGGAGEEAKQKDADEDNLAMENGLDSEEGSLNMLTTKKVMTDIYLCFPSGIIRGALCNLGVQCTVIPQVLSGHSCTYSLAAL